MVTASTPKTTKVAAAKKTVSVKATSLATESELPVVKKKAAAKPKVVKVAATSAAPAATVAAPAAAHLNDEQKARYVEVAAFYIAEQRGFTAGNPTDDWLTAEAEVDRLIATGMFPAEA